VGEAIGPVAFSSIAAQPAYLATPEARSFMRAYGRCLDWLLRSTPDEVALRLSPFFASVQVDVLARSISDYRSLGCWDRSAAIPRSEYEQALDVFEWNGLISVRHDYDAVVSDPWADPDPGT
jgi:hypothetical protein